MKSYVKKEDYCPPECVVLEFTVEKNLMSGFGIDDWQTDPDELG